MERIQQPIWCPKKGKALRYLNSRSQSYCFCSLATDAAQLICDSSDFFAEAFKGKPGEGAKTSLHMVDESVTVFNLFIRWLYRGKTRNILNNHKKGLAIVHLNNLFELYFFAHKLRITALIDAAMDSIQDISAEHRFLDVMIHPLCISRVLQNTTGTGGLALYCANLLLYFFRKHPGKTSGVGNESDDEQYLTSDQRKVVWILSRNSFDFFDTFINAVESSLQRDDGELIDPRRRNEGDHFDRCFFHCHAKSYDCRAD